MAPSSLRSALRSQRGESWGNSTSLVLWEGSCLLCQLFTIQLVSQLLSVPCVQRSKLAWVWGETDKEDSVACPSGVLPLSLQGHLTHLPTTVLLLGRAPRGRGRKHKATPLPPPRLADVAPVPPKAPTRKRGEEGTERMVQALTELLRRAQAPQAPRSRACEPSTPRRSRGRPPGRPAGPCRKKQQAVVVAEAAVTIPKPEPPPPVVPVKNRTGSWKCKEGPGPGPGTPKRGGQPGRGGRGGRGRGRGGLPLMIKFVSKAKKVKMGQLSQGPEAVRSVEHRVTLNCELKYFFPLS